MNLSIDMKKLSSQYSVRKLKDEDVPAIYELSAGNTIFYQYCPPFVTKEGILADMNTLPPGTVLSDKYYVGYFKRDELIAVMDLILNYPNKGTAYIGLFMMKKAYQGKGIGSDIIRECLQAVKGYGYGFSRLAFAKGNPQSEAFWKRNGFEKTGVESDHGDYVAVVMEKAL